MVKLRLRRMGRKARPVYDIVAADTRSPRDGRFIEKVGQYNPMVSTNQVTLKRDRALHWLKTGAQPTDTVRSLLRHEGLLLELHLHRKKKSPEEIAQAVAQHQEKRATKNGAAQKDAPKAAAPAPAPAVEAPAAEAAPEVAPEAPVESTPAAEEAPAAE